MTRLYYLTIGFFLLCCGLALPLLLPATHGSTPVAPLATDTKAFLAYVLALEPEDFATYTHPVQGFSFLYPTAYVVSTDVTDEGETVRAVSPRFQAGIEVTSGGPVDSIVWEEGTRPLVVVRPHPSLGSVADAWCMDGGDLYQVWVWAPHAD